VDEREIQLGATVEDVDDDVRDAIARLVREHPPSATPPARFWAAQFDAGLAWVDFPSGCGGLGKPVPWRAVVEQRLRSAGASFDNADVNPVGHRLLAETIAAHGAPDQRDRYLRRLFTSDEIWCQLFSEPGSGSDLASLATRAERDGDEWVVNGQKVWSSFAQDARRGLLMTRTDPDVPKHRGITAFALDMQSPGVQVRPLREMTGGAQFHEVFLTDVGVPDADRIGAVNGGWGVAVTTLMVERVILSGSAPRRGSGPIGDAVRIWREQRVDDPVRRDQLMRLWMQAECLRLTNIRAAVAGARATPGPEGSIGKLQAAELNQRIYRLCLGLLDAKAMVDIAGGGRQNYLESDGAITWAFLRSRANTVEGGTSEVMRNIIAERVTGQAQDPRVDRDVPWSQLPRN
jgi:alkylation response protein AidB-like acyl-CoA dehydrogenase